LRQPPASGDTCPDCGEVSLAEIDHPFSFALGDL
jgi:hypothetical protein